MQKNTEKMKKGKSSRAHGKRIFCLLLTLVLTLTGLPMGGVETAKAAGVSYGKNSYGSFSLGTYTLYVNGSGAADSEYEVNNQDMKAAKNRATTISFGEKVTSVTGFRNMKAVTKVVFNGKPELAEGFLGMDQGTSPLTTVVLPPNCTDAFEAKVKEVVEYSTGKSDIKYVKQYNVNIINVEQRTGSVTDSTENYPSVINHVWQKKYTDEDFSNDQSVDICIQEAFVPNSKVVFKEWIVSSDNSSQSGTSGVAGVTMGENLASTATGAAILTLSPTADTPSTIYVTATYEEKEQIDLQLALNQMWTEISTYGQDKALDDAPAKGTVQESLNALLKSMTDMVNTIQSCSVTSISGPAITPATTAASGSAVYTINLSAQNTSSNIATKNDCELTFTLRQKENTPYIVVASGGSIVDGREDPSTGEWKITYDLSELEEASEPISVTITSNDRTGEYLYYDGWEVTDLSTGQSVTLESQTPAGDKVATGSAVLHLTQNSPSPIRVVAKYKEVKPATPEDPGETKPSRPIGGGGAPAPSEPAKPADTEKPTDPTKPTDTESTTDPTKPTDTETTEDPANPTDPTTPTQPISVSTKTNTAKVKVEDLQEAADNQQGMTVKYKNATVKFDATAVASIAKQAKNIGGSTISLVCKPGAASSLNSAQKKALKNKTVIECYSIYLKCGSKKITTFGKGKVTVKVPVTLTAAQKSKNVKLYYVDDKGKLTKVTITYKSGYLTFKTTHFSIYAAIYPKTAQTTDTATDKDTDKDTTQKPEKELGTENETLASGSVTDEDIVGLPSVVKGETVNFRTLQLRLTRSDDTSVRLAWNQVKDADGYELYSARCNTDTKRYEIVRIETLGSPMFTAWICSNLKKNTYYKFVVRAYKLDGDEKIYIARSCSAHVATGGNGYGFITDVTVNRSKVTLAVGKTFTIKASVDTGSQKIRPHYSVRYESTKPSVATVNSSGKITAKKKGTCYIYVYTQNGIYTKVKVTVR